MCTKSEVRDVIYETRAPLWVRYAVGFISITGVGFLGWLALSVHNQESDMIAALGNMRLTYSTSNAEIIGRMDRLTDQLENIKEIAIDRSKDRYTGSQARSRNTLVDERCTFINRRLKEIEVIIEKHHEIK